MAFFKRYRVRQGAPDFYWLEGTDDGKTWAQLEGFYTEKAARQVFQQYREKRDQMRNFKETIICDEADRSDATPDVLEASK